MRRRLRGRSRVVGLGVPSWATDRPHPIATVVPVQYGLTDRQPGAVNLSKDASQLNDHASRFQTQASIDALSIPILTDCVFN